MRTQAERARSFRALHERPGIFVMPNPWDAGTAKLLASLGFEALATTLRRTVPSLGSALSLRELEAVERMAVCVRVGLPEDAHLVTAKIGRYLEASGERLAGPSREVFLRPPDLDRMHEAVVEMQFPIGSNRG